jgi:hypothetical protein
MTPSHAVRRLRWSRLCIAAGVVAIVGCSGSTASPSPAPSGPSSATPVPTAAAPTPTIAPATASPAAENLIEPFPSGAFSEPTTVDNRWFPLKPGTRWVWEGTAIDEGERIKRRVIFTVTDLTKVVDGVRTVVAYDIDETAGELDEVEIALFAQADDGTVWHFGQYPEVYDGDKIVETPAWFHGVGEARAGITMKADPEPYAPSYSQGWGPEVGWNDRAKVFETDSKTCVPAGCYDGVLVMDEFSRDEPDAHQLKYYAPGVGGVRIGWAGSAEEEQEVLELVSVTQLSADEMAKVRAELLAMEQRGYRLSPEVYGKTVPMEGP